MKESDLYPAVKRLLEGQGYEVKGEIADCDVVAVRGEEEPVIVELKLSLNLDLLLQAADRLAVSSIVYIGVPSSSRKLKTHGKRITKLLRLMGFGLLSIDPKEGVVKVLLDPGTYAPRRSKGRKARLLGEFAKRVGDPNAGGSEKRKGIVTAYRQRAMRIADFLRTNGPAKASTVAKTLDIPKAREVLYRNVYGWFDGQGKGIYTLSPRGIREQQTWAQDRP